MQYPTMVMFNMTEPPIFLKKVLDEARKKCYSIGIKESIRRKR